MHLPLSNLSEAAARDADLAALVQSGRLQAAFEGLLERYERKVYHLCIALLRDTPQAQDAAQDSLLRVWRSLGAYCADKGALATWIYAITRNHCLTLLSARGQRLARETSLDDPATWTLAEQVAAPPGAQGDVAQVLRALVDALPPAYARCVTLYYFEERSVADVAAMLDVPEGTVKTHLHRARQALLQALQNRGLASADLCL